jgi:hypothetical protein
MTGFWQNKCKSKTTLAFVRVLCFCFLFVPLFFSTVANAKIFDASKSAGGAYFRGSYGLGLENTLNTKSQGTGSKVDSTTPYNFSGEFGGLYSTKFFNIRVGVEIIYSPEKDTDGIYSSSGAKMYSLTSNIFVLNPKVGIEINVKRWARSRLQLGGSVGYAMLSARNSYAFNSAGTTQYALSDFAEELSATALSFEGMLGYETLMLDSTTIMFEGGYRSLTFDEVTYSKDVINFQGTKAKDAKALSDDGNKRSLDLSQAYVGMAFRFWFY